MRRSKTPPAVAWISSRTEARHAAGEEARRRASSQARTAFPLDELPRFTKSGRDLNTMASEPPPLFPWQFAPKRC